MTLDLAIARMDTGGDGRRHLLRVRWAVRAVLLLGVAASLSANVMHAHPNNYSRVIAAWPPVALFATIEVISRVPIHHRGFAAVRIGATVSIGGIAAWVSYWHMAAVVAHYGEHGLTPYLLPLSVDGLVLVASISLYEIAARIRAESIPPASATGSDPVPDPPAGPEPPRSAPTPTVDQPGNQGREGGELPNTKFPRSASNARLAAEVARLRALDPPPSQETIAQQVHRSVRTVQRIMQTLDDAADAPPAVNGTAQPDLLTHRAHQ